MSNGRLPLLDRVLVTLLLRGAKADFVVGDFVERYAEDLAAGEPRARARASASPGHRQLPGMVAPESGWRAAPRSSPG